jgi:hypothetical protein
MHAALMGVAGLTLLLFGFLGTRRQGYTGRLVVVVAHYTEDLGWLGRTGLPLSICSKTLTEWRDLDAS